MSFKESITGDMSRFIHERQFDEITGPSLKNLKLHLLDSLGCAIGTLDSKPIVKLRNQLEQLGGNSMSSLIGGGMSSVDRAAQYNTALIRYLDFMDNFLAKGETCHPSDNIGSVLAASDFANISGKDFLTALAVAYEVQCRLTEETPMMGAGFDHTTQLTYSITAGVCKALNLTHEQTVHALGIAGSSLNSLSVIRAAPVSEWKGLASSQTALSAVNAVLLAANGVSGPPEVFEGPKGFIQALKKDFNVDWESESLEAINRCLIKKYNSEVHTQTAIDAVIELRNKYMIKPEEVDEIKIRIFKIAYDITGGGEYGNKKSVEFKEQADHDLLYLAAVALIDGNVWPAQFTTERIKSSDVGNLMQKVKVKPSKKFTKEYPDLMKCRVKIKMVNGSTHKIEKSTYEGFWKTPMPENAVVRKFHGLAAPFTDKGLRDNIIDVIFELEKYSVKELLQLLEQAGVRNDR